MNFSDLDFSTLQDIPPHQHYYDTPRISVTEKGLVSMNGAFRRKAGTQREFRIQSSPDGRYLVFYPMETPNIRFAAKGGSATYLELADHLEERGILLTAVHTMAWCPERQIWVGCCEELSQPPALSGLVKGKKRTKEKRSA